MTWPSCDPTSATPYPFKKNEASGTGSIPIIKAVAYVARTQIKMLNDMFCGWRVPCLGVTIVGKLDWAERFSLFISDLQVLMLLFHAIVAIYRQYRAIPCTPTLSCILEESDGKDRKMIYPAFLTALVLWGYLEWWLSLCQVATSLDSTDYPVTPLQ